MEKTCEWMQDREYYSSMKWLKEIDQENQAKIEWKKNPKKKKVKKRVKTCTLTPLLPWPGSWFKVSRWQYLDEFDILICNG